MRYGATTRLSPERAIEKAKEYFGRLDMTLEEESAMKVMFRNDSGHVQVAVSEGHGTELEIETRGYDHQVKQFLQRIG